MEPRLDPDLTHIAPDAFVAANATVLGDVHVGAKASIWFGTVIRGDVEEIRIGDETNIQDNSVIHADTGYPCHIGSQVTIGHRCIIHGAKIGDRALIGMGATVMNGAQIGKDTIVAAGALIPENKTFPDGVLIVGVPGKVKRELSEGELSLLQASAAHYVANGQAYEAKGHGAPKTGRLA